jgi:hypothetical protein
MTNPTQAAALPFSLPMVRSPSLSTAFIPKQFSGIMNVIAGLSIWSQHHRPGGRVEIANIPSNGPSENPDGCVDLSLDLSEINTDRLKEEISRAGTLGSVSLASSGRGIGMITREVEELTTGFSKCFPTGQ